MADRGLEGGKDIVLENQRTVLGCTKESAGRDFFLNLKKYMKSTIHMIITSFLKWHKKC